jgi:hypothetical protein
MLVSDLGQTVAAPKHLPGNRMDCHNPNECTADDIFGLGQTVTRSSRLPGNRMDCHNPNICSPEDLFGLGQTVTMPRRLPGHRMDCQNVYGPCGTEDLFGLGDVLGQLDMTSIPKFGEIAAFGGGALYLMGGGTRSKKWGTILLGLGLAVIAGSKLKTLVAG